MYRLQPHRTIAHEVRRIADEQLSLALFGVRRVGTPYDDAAVAEACRHITKVKALLRLVRPVLDDDSYIPANRRLGVVCRRLEPIAEGRAALSALARFAIHDEAIDVVVALQVIREGLVARAARVDRKAQFDRVLPRSIRMLTVERARVGTWLLVARDFRTIAPGLADSLRRMTEATAGALERPTATRYDAWRRETKDLCLHLRLLEARCSGLAGTRRRLDALDDCLGECHNVMVLERILVTEVLGSRRDTATVLRLLRHDQMELQVRAVRLARAALRETPRQLVQRVANHWRADRPAGGSTSRTRGVAHAA
jgi:hypothetical protein